MEEFSKSLALGYYDMFNHEMDIDCYSIVDTRLFEFIFPSQDRRFTTKLLVSKSRQGGDLTLGYWAGALLVADDDFSAVFRVMTNFHNCDSEPLVPDWLFDHYNELVANIDTLTPEQLRDMDYTYYASPFAVPGICGLDMLDDELQAISADV